VTISGRIVRVDLVSGQPMSQQEIVPATPYVHNMSFSPGSLVRLEGTLPHDADALRGHILIGGVAMPILWVSETEIAAQAPWETPIQADLVLDLPSDSPFQQRDQIFVFPSMPRFEPTLQFIRQDFSSILDRPPQAGEIVHVYMTGLGPVIGSIATGEPAPLDRLLPIQGQFQCQFRPYANPAETLFAGLAPGLIGVYQVTFRMPPDAGARITGGTCTGQGTLSFATLLPGP
jgi:uncharacterized protein (TIGR03437 family)